MKNVCTLLGLLAVIAMATPAQAQGIKDITKPKSKKSAKQFEKLSFAPGKIDLSLNFGAGLSLYPSIGLAVEVGMFELTDGVVVSGGAEINYAYCLGCLLFNGLASYAGEDISLSSSAIIPGARVAIHLPVVSKIADLPQFDPFVGLYLAPSITTAQATVQDFRADLTVLTVTAGAVAGARWMFSDSLFFTGEVRYLGTWAPDPFERDFNGVPVVVDYGQFARNSGEVNLGVGARF